MAASFPDKLSNTHTHTHTYMCNKSRNGFGSRRQLINKLRNANGGGRKMAVRSSGKTFSSIRVVKECQILQNVLWPKVIGYSFIVTADDGIWKPILRLHSKSYDAICIQTVQIKK